MTGDAVIDVHYYAAAADAAGRAHERLAVPASSTVAELRGLLAARGAEMARVVHASGLLLNSVTVPADCSTQLTNGDRVDVLPPFAGG